MKDTIYDVIIIGSGPAAYTAAIYASRAFLKTLVITGPESGGQLTTTTEVENFPGFPKGVNGPQLMLDMKAQAERFGTEIVDGIVSSIKNQASGGKTKIFELSAGSQNYQGRSVIIATGASVKRLGIPSERKFNGKGVSYCATCDGFFFRGKNIAVLGGGDTAMEDATFLTRFAAHVTIIHRRDEFRASPIMLEKAKKDPKISFLSNTTVEEFVGDTVLKTVKLKDTKTGQTKEVNFDGVFVAIGHIPNTAFVKGFVETDEKGYIIIKSEKLIVKGVNELQTLTNVDGVFAAGDCVDFRYRQAVVAAGMGCMAAMDVQKWLEK